MLLQPFILPLLKATAQGKEIKTHFYKSVLCESYLPIFQRKIQIDFGIWVVSRDLRKLFITF